MCNIFEASASGQKRLTWLQTTRTLWTPQLTALAVPTRPLHRHALLFFTSRPFSRKRPCKISKSPFPFHVWEVLHLCSF